MSDGRGRAHRLVANSRAIASARATFRAWGGGRLSTDQAQALLDLANTVHDEFDGAETRLIDIVEDLSVTDTRRALGYWRQSVDGPGTVIGESEQLAWRGISASKSLNGMLRVDGWMTPLAGEALLAALDTLMPPPTHGDDRTPRQRRHDALEDLARDFLDHAGTAQTGGEKPHVNVVCDLPALQGIAGGLHETENGHLLSVDDLRMLACDSSVCRIVLGPKSEIIDVGRRTRVVPAALRRAVIARDRHCTWPGCDRGPRWCDVHHRKHWAEGGPTEPVNLRLLCRFHHTLLHRAEDPGRDPPDGLFT